MNHSLKFHFLQVIKTSSATKFLFGLLLAAVSAGSAHAQGQIASGTVGGVGSGPYIYSLSFADGAAATQPIGSVWYAWVPGQFFLPSAPTSAAAPAGWTATISGNSIQYVANSAANDILAGGSLSGFSYHANFSPAQLAAAPNSGESVAYSGALSGPSTTFFVQPAPEPTSLALLICGGLGWFALGRQKARPC